MRRLDGVEEVAVRLEIAPEAHGGAVERVRGDDQRRLTPDGREILEPREASCEVRPAKRGVHDKDVLFPRHGELDAGEEQDSLPV